MKTVIRVSGSIWNFHDKLQAYLQLDDWHWWRNRNDQVIFFGLYHWKDYIRFIWHRGPKKVFWCGSDILALKQQGFWNLLIFNKGKHYCENEVERNKLILKGIKAEIRPMLFDDPDKYPISYKWAETPNIYICAHKDREKEYGVDTFVEFAHSFPDIRFHIYGIEKPEVWFDLSINEMRNLYYQLPNLTYHGVVSEAQYNQETKEYQGFVRLNEFDGASEIMTKGLLLGQYGMVSINYPNSRTGYLTEWFADFVRRKEPNIEASNYWRKTLKDNKEEVVNNWR